MNRSNNPPVENDDEYPSTAENQEYSLTQSSISTVARIPLCWVPPDNPNMESGGAGGPNNETTVEDNSDDQGGEKKIAEFYDQFSFIVNGYVTCGLMIVGLISVALAITIFLRVRQRPLIYYYLIGLEIWNGLLLIFAFLLYSLPYLLYGRHVHYGPYAYSYVFSYAGSNMTLVGTVWMVLVLTVDRYLSLCHPLTHKAVSRRRVIRLLVAVSFLAILYSLPRFFELELRHCRQISTAAAVDYEKKEAVTLPTLSVYIQPSLIRSNPLYNIGYKIFGGIIFYSLCPFLTLLLLTVKIGIAIRQSIRHRRLLSNQLIGRAIARSNPSAALLNGGKATVSKPTVKPAESSNSSLMLMAVTIKFLLSHSMPTLMDLAEVSVGQEQFGSSLAANFMVTFSNLFLVLNSSSNLVIYLIWGTRFRLEFGNFFCGNRRNGIAYHIAKIQLLIPTFAAASSPASAAVGGAAATGMTPRGGVKTQHNNRRGRGGRRLLRVTNTTSFLRHRNSTATTAGHFGAVRMMVDGSGLPPGPRVSAISLTHPSSVNSSPTHRPSIAGVGRSSITTNFNNHPVNRRPSTLHIVRSATTTTTATKTTNLPPDGRSFPRTLVENNFQSSSTATMQEVIMVDDKNDQKSPLLLHPNSAATVQQQQQQQRRRRSSPKKSICLGAGAGATAGGNLPKTDTTNNNNILTTTTTDSLIASSSSSGKNGIKQQQRQVWNNSRNSSVKSTVIISPIFESPTTIVVPTPLMIMPAPVSAPIGHNVISSSPFGPISSIGSSAAAAVVSSSSTGIETTETTRIVQANSGIDTTETTRIMQANSGIDTTETTRIMQANSGIDTTETTRIRRQQASSVDGGQNEPSITAVNMSNSRSSSLEIYI